MVVNTKLPEHRKQILNSIQPSHAHYHHDFLRELFVLEMDYRRSDSDLEYFENIYQCAYLLFRIGDPSDTSLMWEAKNINFDLGCGFDVHALFGAGYKETLDYLSEKGLDELVLSLSEYREFCDSNEVKLWSESQFDYYYKDIKEELLPLGLWVESN